MDVVPVIPSLMDLKGTNDGLKAIRIWSVLDIQANSLILQIKGVNCEFKSIDLVPLSTNIPRTVILGYIVVSAGIYCSYPRILRFSVTPGGSTEVHLIRPGVLVRVGVGVSDAQDAPRHEVVTVG